MMSQRDLIIVNIKNAIKHQRRNTIKAHFAAIVHLDREGYVGFVNENGFEVWRNPTILFFGWMGIIYPVILGTFDDSESDHLRLRSRLSPVSFIAVILFACLLGLGIIMTINNANWISSSLWDKYLIGFLSWLLMIKVFNYGYKLTCEKEKESIKKLALTGVQVKRDEKRKLKF